MARDLRTLDDRWRFTDAAGRSVALYDVTADVTGGLALLKPDPACEARVLGVLGRSQTHWDFELYAFSVRPNSVRLLVGVADLPVKADLLAFGLSGISREIKGLRGWFASVFGRRNDAIQITDDAHALRVARELLAAGTDDHLVRHPSDEPYPSWAPWALRGATPWGTWTDRTALGEARRRGRPVDAADFSTRYPVRLSRLPALRHLTDAEHQGFWDDVATDIARVARVRRKKAGRRLLGAEHARRLDPLTRLTPGPRRPRPLAWGSPAVVAAHREAYLERRRRYRLATAAHRAAQAGGHTQAVCWPTGTLAPLFARARGGRPAQPRRPGLAAR
ncbi:MAG: hypothetical protein H6706_03360 [Myxococcales bacterium]|nr:hypothetical protein [Myxococcales bacterium]